MADGLQTAAGIASLLTAMAAWKYVLERPIRRLYHPPGGGWMLFATWGLAISVISVAYSYRESYPWTAGLLTVLAIPAALCATIIYRDQRLEYEGKEPVRDSIPTRIGVASRIVWSIVAIAVAVGTGFYAFDSSSTAEEVFFLGGLSVTLLGIAWKGTIPQKVRERLGAPPESPTLP